MKKILFFIFCLLGSFVISQKIPEIMKTTFSSEALQEKVTDKSGNQVTIESILKRNEGEVLVLSFWASWCKDCLVAMPQAQELRERNPKVVFLYLSLDRTEEAWKKAIDKYDFPRVGNYWFHQGWKNPFNNYIDLNWIPRYMIIDKNGKIAKYYAITPTDPDIQKTIDKLLK